MFALCGDRQTQVCSIAISCLGCLHFVHKKYNRIKKSSPTFRIHAFPLPGHNDLSMVDRVEKLEAVKEVCHLGEILSAEGSCELTVPTL